MARTLHCVGFRTTAATALEVENGEAKAGRAGSQLAKEGRTAGARLRRVAAAEKASGRNRFSMTARGRQRALPGGERDRSDCPAFRRIDDFVIQNTELSMTGLNTVCNDEFAVAEVDVAGRKEGEAESESRTRSARSACRGT